MYEIFERNNDINLCILVHDIYNDGETFLNILYTHKKKHSRNVTLFFHKKVPPVNEEKEGVIEVYQLRRC